MKKNSIVFIDTSAWIAILDDKKSNHSEARIYFDRLLAQSSRIVTNNFIVDETIALLKGKFSSDFAKQFLAIINESVLSVTLRVDWISRRNRRIALDNFFKTSNVNLSLKHFYIYESLKRKKVDFVFSYDEHLKHFDIPVMPQNSQN